MGDDDGHRASSDLVRDHGLDAFHGAGVQAGRRLVEQKQIRLVHDGPREGDALALAARRGPHRTRREGADAEALRASLPRGADVRSGQPRGELDILAACQIRIAERLVAEPPDARADDAERSPERPVIDAARGGTDERSEHPEERALSGAVRPFDDDQRPAGELERGVDDGPNRTEALADVQDVDGLGGGTFVGHAPHHTTRGHRRASGLSSAAAG